MFRLRLLLSIAVLSLVLAVLPASAVRAQDASPIASSPSPIGSVIDKAPDIPAMPVTPADVEAAGFPGFGRFYNGQFASVDIFVDYDAVQFGQPIDQARTFYESIGWSRFYFSTMGFRGEDGVDGLPSRAAFANIIEFDDASGADAYLTYISSPGSESDRTFTYFDDPFTIGDQSVIYEVKLFATEANFSLFELNLFFRVDNIVVDVGFGAYSIGRTAFAATPVVEDGLLVSPAGTLAQLEAIGRRQLERINAVQSGGSPNLPGALLRIGDDPNAETVNYTEGYRLLDGEFPPYYDGFQDDILADPNASAGANAIYELEQAFQAGEGSTMQEHYLLTRLYHFPDEMTAGAFLTGRPDALATGGFRLATGATDEASTNLLPGEVTDLGDESLAFSFVRAFDDGGRFEGFEIYVRVGALVAAVSVEGPPSMPLEQVAEIAAAQAACLEAGSCPDALPIPDAFISGQYATPVAGTPST